jgi:F-type H+-transporting ATPase subunit b
VALLWRVFNLALLLGVLIAFARKPLLAWFAERRDRIRGELESAAALRREAEKRYAHWQRQLVDLDAELERVRTTARERAESDRQRLLADARAAAERIKGDARAAMAQEVRRARESLRQEASDLAVELATRQLRDQVTESDRDRLVDEFIATIERSSPNGSGR